MNLKELQAQDTITFQIMDPREKSGRTPLCKDDGEPMTITAYTSDSKQYRGITAEIRRAHKGRDPGEEIDPVELGNELLMKVITAWDMPYDKGKNATREQLEDMMRDPAYAWLQQQVDKAVHDRARFFGGPPSA